MKYFIRKRKDCISSFLLVGGEKKMEAGHKEKRFFWNYCVCVCDEWRGSARIGCWWRREVEKNVENVDVVSKVMEKKI